MGINIRQMFIIPTFPDTPFKSFKHTLLKTSYSSEQNIHLDKYACIILNL